MSAVRALRFPCFADRTGLSVRCRYALATTGRRMRHADLSRMDEGDALDLDVWLSRPRRTRRLFRSRPADWNSDRSAGPPRIGLPATRVCLRTGNQLDS